MYSANYEKVKQYYNTGLWSKSMLINAVGRWITKEEYEKIVQEKYVDGKELM